MSKPSSKPDTRIKPRPQAPKRKPAGKAKPVDKSPASRSPAAAPGKGKAAKPKATAPKPAVPKPASKARHSKPAPAPRTVAPKPTAAPRSGPAPKSAVPKSGPASQRRPRPVSESSRRKRALHLPEVPSDRPGPRMEQVLQAEIQPWKRDALSDEEAQLRELKSIPTRNMYDTEEARRRLIGRPPTSGKRRLTKTKTSSSNAS